MLNPQALQLRVGVDVGSSQWPPGDCIDRMCLACANLGTPTFPRNVERAAVGASHLHSRHVVDRYRRRIVNRFTLPPASGLRATHQARESAHVGAASFRCEHSGSSVALPAARSLAEGLNSMHLD